MTERWTLFFAFAVGEALQDGVGESEGFVIIPGEVTIEAESLNVAPARRFGYGR